MSVMRVMCVCVCVCVCDDEYDVCVCVCVCVPAPFPLFRAPESVEECGGDEDCHNVHGEDAWRSPGDDPPREEDVAAVRQHLGGRER